ncbi:hypothetical protein ACFE04_030098 [Oxalis oulophora]
MLTSRVIPTPTPRFHNTNVKHLILENFELDGRVSSAKNFIVLLCNILSDAYASNELYTYCPSWTLSWAYHSTSLSLLIQTPLLKEHGIEPRHLSSEHVQTKYRKMVYIVNAHYGLMRFICANTNNDLSKELKREYCVYFFPHCIVSCEMVLEEEKEKNFEVHGDTTSLWHVSKVIHKLELSFGVIPHIMAKGKSSDGVVDI